MRLFVAVYPPIEAMDHLAARVETLQLGLNTAAGRSVGLIPRSRWHITLVFLGEVEPQRVGEVSPAITAVAQAGWAGADPLRLRLAGGGRFGRGRFTICWTGIDGDVAALGNLARQLRRGLRRARLGAPDPKPFRPHLTLARPGQRLSPAEVAADLDSLAGYRGPWWPAEEMWLVQSRPGPSPEYVPVSSVRLGNSG